MSDGRPLHNAACQPRKRLAHTRHDGKSETPAIESSSACEETWRVVMGYFNQYALSY
ncbi:hypothetical protein XFF6992_210048 [Xanthomonas citri pv. fuscans]|uniref:hypothetical protein n=1 Tax=Xanthomonas citri TaxID=346 RepID=UPI000C359F7F|nr:hypothetical protein [Xanthomonas citri]QTD87952.1 hypothetical protein XcfCFBP6988P_23675 [Xanthomonas citri pv. phaseoli var. fuscans]QTF14039.1 hypothetical protein XcfCFBP6989P_23585 [Xanthomonas citri pv. phaseoli var. fuscans]QTF19399.1 hypothetical protein XcfCFBP6992P_23680 [Xanthomonas citri pv. phaseoli var. fuscans]QTF76688.1 hypothetical protein XcfCFBP6996P_22930 [Xanthomonas citri pv. phaseoli var. fuscans]SOO18072.1 hypothetical protein XFF6992_210048 [Xanthomonas citri pv. f